MSGTRAVLARPRRPIPMVAAIILATVLAVLLLPAGAASAHTELESSSPAAGATVTEPLGTISLTFTQAVSIPEQSIQLFDERGQPVAISEVVASPDGATVSTTTPEPLPNGRFGVLWQVQASDGHIVSGSYEFVVDVPAPPTTTNPPTTTTRPPPTTRSTRTTPSTTEQAAATTPGTTPPADAPTTAAPTDDTSGGTVPGTILAGGGGGTGGGHGGHSSALDEALHSHGSGGTAWWSRPASILLIGGTVLAVGMVLFALAALGGSTGYRGQLVNAARVAAAVAAVAAVLDALGHSWSLGDGVFDGLGDVLGGSLGVATGLRVAGGLLVAFSWAASTATWDRLADERAGIDGLRAIPIPAAVGLGALVLSFAFDGHTVSRGPRLLHSLVDVVHVSAGAAWAGGIVAFAVVLLRSRLREGAVAPRSVSAAVSPATTTGDAPATDTPARRPELAPLDVLMVGLRFSSIATVALVAVALAGSAMAVMILDSLSGLWDTSWGTTLLLKVGATAIAATLGAVNHFVLLPRLQADPDDQATRDSLRSIVLCEVVMVVIIVVLTGFLVAASPV